MQRRWVLIVGSFLALLGLVLLGLFLLREDPAGDAPEEGTLDDLLAASASNRELADTRGGAPTLTGVRGGTPNRPTAAGEGAPAVAASAPSGPVDFVVVSHTTTLPLEKVELRDKAGAVLARTDEEGRAQIERVPGAGLLLHVAHTGYLPARVRVRPEDQVEIALRPGVQVLGRIVRAGTRGDPGVAQVSVWDEDLKREIASFTTDESGTFEIGAVRPNHPFLMTVRLTGLVPQVKRILVDMPRKDLVVVIGEGGHLTGRVHSDADVPLSGLEVRLLRAYEPILEQRAWREGETRADLAHLAARVASTRTDEDGLYAFHGVPLGVKVQPVVLARGRHVARGQDVTFEDLDQTVDRGILVPAGARLRIRITDENDKAIGDADLEIRAARSVWHVRPTDERTDGAVLLRDLTPAPFHLTITRPGAPTLHESGMLVAGEEASVHVIVPLGLELHGKVKDKRGAPIWKALVQWSAGEEKVDVRTEWDGSFRFRNLTIPMGTVQVGARDLSVSPFGYEDLLVPDVPAGGPPLQVTLKDGTRVRGSFRGLPPGGQVHSSMVPGTRYDDARLALDDEFHFVRRGPLPDQTALFVFRTRGRPPILRQEQTPFESEEARDLGTLFFEALNPRKGRVLDEQGLPLWAAKVTLETPWSLASVRTDRKGDFVFAHMPRRDLDILIEAQGYPATPVVLETGSEFRPQLIQLRRRVEVTVQVVASDRARLRKVKLSFQLLSAGAGPTAPREYVTDRVGRLRIHIAPGRYNLTAKDKKTGTLSTRMLPITNEPQQRVQIELR